MASGVEQPFVLEAVDSKSVLKCYRLSASACAFKVVTPQLAYDAIFLRLDDEVLEPDMVLTMNRTLTLFLIEAQIFSHDTLLYSVLNLS